MRVLERGWPRLVRTVCATLRRPSMHAGNDVTLLALWLGHESVRTTQIYIHADLAIKEKALDRTAPMDAAQGRYRPPDALLAFLEAL